MAGRLAADGRLRFIRRRSRRYDAVSRRQPLVLPIRAGHSPARGRVPRSVVELTTGGVRLGFGGVAGTALFVALGSLQRLRPTFAISPASCMRCRLDCRFAIGLSPRGAASRCSRWAMISVAWAGSARWARISRIVWLINPRGRRRRLGVSSDRGTARRADRGAGAAAFDSSASSSSTRRLASSRSSSA